MDIRIQRGWMYNRMLGRDFNPEWLVGVNQFIEFAKSNIQSLGSRQIRCPCRKCKNKRYADYEEVHAHVLANGFVADYWYWTCHGEVQPYNLNTNIRASSSDHIMEDEEDNRYEDVVYDAMRGGSFDCTVEILDAAQRPLYEGCNTQSELSLALQLMALKADYNMTHGCFNRMTQIMKTLPPTKENLVPNDFYKAKKLVAKLGLSSTKIDCCENGCMLYYKEDQHLTKCKFCKFERFKSSKSGRDTRTGKLVPHNF
ncbi:hypothetical protein ACJIZ3_011837 [Penstemon smallii]|uniref:Transposase-associated domain-containing protein n=1 Tax=Penstemon smallii TaxID=265156 RepID=A0ABD3UNV5_9LAMI